MADFEEGAPAADDFKTIHHAKSTHQELPMEPNKIQQPKTDKVKRERADKKWTTVQNMFSRKKERLFESLPAAREERKDFDPLFSSFNPDGVFHAPPSSKEALQ